MDRFFFLPKSLTLFFNDFLTLTQMQNVFVWQERGILLLHCLSICLSVLGSASLLLSSLRNLFIFCINVDIDKMLLSDKIKGLGVNSFTVI